MVVMRVLMLSTSTWTLAASLAALFACCSATAACVSASVRICMTSCALAVMEASAAEAADWIDESCAAPSEAMSARAAVL